MKFKSLLLSVVAISFLSYMPLHAQTGHKTTGLDSRLIAVAHCNSSGSTFTPRDSTVYGYMPSGKGGFIPFVIRPHFINPTFNYVGQYDTLKKMQYYTGMYHDSALQWRSYDTHNNLLTETSQYYDTSASAWMNNNLMTYTYDANNNPLTYLYQNWDTTGGGTWKNYQRDGYTYDAANNRLTDTTAYSYSGIWSNYQVLNNTYDSHNNLTSTITYTWVSSSDTWKKYLKVAYYLNTSYNPDSVVNYNWDTAGGGTWKAFTKDKYTYDASQNVLSDTSSSYYTSSWVYSYNYNYGYNTSNDQVMENRKYYSSSSHLWNNSDSIIRTFDGNHNRLSAIEMFWYTTSGSYKNYTKATTTYNSYNQMLTYTTNSWNDTTSTWYVSAFDIQNRFYYETYTGVPSLNKNQGDVQIFPSPANNMVHINLKWNNAQKAIIRVYDATGRLWDQRQTNATNEYNGIIPVANYPAGNYLISVTGQTGQLTKMFTVVH